LIGRIMRTGCEDYLDPKIRVIKSIK